MPWIINLGGLLLIALIVWWFWFARNVATQRVASALVDVRMQDGVFTPTDIELPVGRLVTLRIHRADPSSCAEQVLIPDLDIAVSPPVNGTIDIPVKFEQPGVHEFTCQMGMYRGRLHVTT